MSRRTSNRSADSVDVGTSLVAHPCLGILIPLMPGVRDGAARGQDQVPTGALLKRRGDRLTDEATAIAGAAALIDLSQKGVVQLYVYSHVLNLAHGGPGDSRYRGRITLAGVGLYDAADVRCDTIWK